MSEPTYVFDNVEVKLTGRSAEKTVGVQRSDYGGRVPPRIDVLVEITPVIKETGSWKKWVRKTDLYEVKKQENNND